MKRLLTIFAVLLLLFALPLTAAAEEQDEALVDLDPLIEASGLRELTELLPGRTEQLMEQLGIEEISLQSMMRLSPTDFLRLCGSLLLDQAAQPLKAMAAIIGIIIICAVVEGLRPKADETVMGGIVGTVGVLCVSVAVIGPVIDCIREVCTAIEGYALFMASYTPIYAGVITANGQPASAAVYNTLLFGAAQISASVSRTTLLPLMGIFLAVSVVGSVAPGFCLNDIAKTVRNVVSWALGLILTVFTGIMGMQTMVTAGADTVSVRTAKFMVSSFVPVVGGALSEALVTAQSCIKLLKSVTGVFGITAAVVSFLPVLLTILAWLAAMGLCRMVSGVTGAKAVSSSLEAVSATLGILLAVTVCYMLFMIITTTIMLVAGNSGA